MSNEFKFNNRSLQDAQDALDKKLFINRLPEWMQNSEQIQSFCDDVIQQWFTPQEQVLVDGYIGDRGSPVAAGKIFLPEMNTARQEYQLSPAYVSRQANGNVRSLQFYQDLVGYLKHYGSLTSNENRLMNGYFYSWTPPINPNKFVNFSSYLWDNENEYNIRPDYVIMERGADNGNIWSLQNFWYTVGQTLPDGTILTEEMSMTSRFKRAQAPIIEYNKNIELQNYGTQFRGTVDYYSTNIKPEDIVQRKTSDDIRVDGFILKAGDRIMFTSIGNSGENNRIYRIVLDTMQDGTMVYGVVLDENEESELRPSGEPLLGDTILVRKGNTYANTAFYWNGKSWIPAQVKNGINSFPKFNLYDKDGIILNDPLKYPSSTFNGTEMFGLKINYSYPEDKIYNTHVELSSYNYYVFENFLQTIRYSYLKTGVMTEIGGLYYYKITKFNSDGKLSSNLKTDWVRNEHTTKQFVRQVPTMEKRAMFKIFNTLYEMNSFTSPLVNMYAYVVETDQNYRYFKRDNANFESWNPINMDAIQSDVYNKEFKVAQRIDPSDNNEIIEVYLDGDQLLKDVYYELDENNCISTVKLGDSYTLKETSIVDIRTYSPTKEFDETLGAFEIPMNLKNNPYNENIDYIHQGNYTLHFLDIIRQNITKGSVNDINDYEERLEKGLVNNAVGTQIIQNEASILPLMLHSANEDLNLFEAIMYCESEYFRFKNKFTNKMLEMYNTDSTAFLEEIPSTIVDMILNSINIGKDDSFPFAFCNVGSTPSVPRTYIPPTPQFLGILQSYRPQKSTPMFVGKSIGRYNVDHCGVVSKSYVNINGVGLMDDVIFELEQRIYNSIDNTFKNIDYVPVLNSTLLEPTAYNQETEYSRNEYNSLLLRGYTNFLATNSIDGTTHVYDQNNWMTWNFSGTTYIVDGKPTDIPARASWRSIYVDVYGTYRPYSHPWEMFGFSQRPEWFNLEYKPTKVRLSEDPSDYVYVYETFVVNENGDLVPSGLWDYNNTAGAASKGLIAGGSRQGVYPELRRCGKQPFTIHDTGEVTTDGEKIQEIKLLSPMEGLISGTLQHRAEPWSIGDMGDMEFTYMNTPMFVFEKALTLLRAKPVQFANYFYDTKGSTLQKVHNNGYQFLYGDSNSRLNFNSKTLVHSEDKSRILGYQTWVSDFLINQNKNVTLKYGDILRSSFINVGHRLGAFSKVDQLTFSSDSFGLISQENQYIGLVKSSVLKEATMSAIKIVYNGSGYIVNGYDLVSPYIPYYKPKKTSRRHTIKVGTKSYLHYNDYETTVNYMPYDSILNTPQEVYELLCSYGAYLENNGWIFEEHDENGEINNWNQIAKSFVNWSQTNLNKGDFISVSPSTKSIKYGMTFGSVQSVTQYSGGVWTLLDDKNQGIRPDEIDTVRLGNVFSVRINDDINKRMALIRLNTISYEHAVIFDDVTIFGDNVYIPKYGSVHEMIKMYGYITGSWNGRMEAPGFMILESGTLPNFEKLVSDFTQYYNNDVPVDNSSLKELSRHLIGFQTRDYIREMISNESSQIDFYRGYIKEKGTQQAFEKVLRVSKTYNTENYKALEEWAFKIGTYGNVNGKKHLQFQLFNNKFNQEPQLFKFDENLHTDDSTNGSITFFGKQGEDSSWIYRPNTKFSFPVRYGKSTRINLPDIGPVTLDEVDFSTTDFTTIYEARTYFTNTYKKFPTKVWMFRDSKEQWNIFNIVKASAKLVKIEPIDDDEYNGIVCKLTFNVDHNLKDGEYYFLNDINNYMPDLLKGERQYYITEAKGNEIIIKLNVKNTIEFDDGEEPELYVYKDFFKSDKEKDDYVNKKYSYPAPQSAYFERPSTYNSQNNMTELYLNVYDPINGIIPGKIMSDITYVTSVDPARYNSDVNTIEAWGNLHVGKVWWDTTNAFYLDYTRPILDKNGNVDEVATLEYKRSNWGKLLPESSIDMYEWVKSPVEPYLWDDYCTKQAKLNKGVTSWVPSGEAIEDSFSMFDEYDSTIGEYRTFYYFWVRNPIYVPKLIERTKSVNELVRSLLDPMTLNTPWFAPISKNAYICSNLSKDITDDKSILTITYQNDATEVVKHEQYQLCKEGLDYNFNSNVWNTMSNSLIGYETINDKENSLLYPSVELGCQPGKTWFKDIIEARRTFTHSANNIFKSLNMITNSVMMNDVFNVKTTERNPNLIDIKILSFNNEFVILPMDERFKENDPVLISTTGTLPEPLNANEVYFIHVDDNTGYLRLMRSPSSAGNNTAIISILDKGEGTHSMIKQSDYIEALGTSLDMTQYWDYTDWYDIGYNENTPYVKEVSLESADQKNYQEGDIIRVVGSDGIWTLYVKIFSRSVTMWQAVGRQNSTIKLNDRLYNYESIYDSTGNLSPRELNIRNALSLLVKSFDNVQSRMVFDMVKYVHTEQTVVDWVFKTSFIYVIGLEQSLQRSYLEQDNLINQIVAYFEETKPYRTKIRSQIEQKTSDEDEVNGISNDLDPNGYIFVNGKWIKTENDIWDYEYAEKDSNGKWVVKGELPSDFVTPNRRFQEMNTVLQFDNMQCKPSEDLKDIHTLETTNNNFVTMKTDLLGTNEHYVLQRFEFSTPDISYESINDTILALLRLEYTWLPNTLSLAESINTILVKYKDDIDETNKFNETLDKITNDVYNESIAVNDALAYTQYNTLANRSRLYTEKSDDDIAREVGCPFKGKFISDNPNTRLPFGYSAVSDYNYGYIHWGSAVMDKFIELVEQNHDTSTNSIDDILINEYGVYRWADNKKSSSSAYVPPVDEDGEPIVIYDKNFSDAVNILALTMNIVEKDGDHYEKVKQILLNAITLDSDAIIMIPRKYLVCIDPTDNKVLNIPISMSIEQFMEEYYIRNSVNVTLKLIDSVMDDLALNTDSPLYSDYKEILTGINDAKYFNDMNAFDNLGLESQTKRVVKTYRGDIKDTKDSIFVDISELNPNLRDIAQLRFTVNGYNYDNINNLVLKDTGNFQIEGHVILNPYNRSEVLISIPRYNEALDYMNKDLITKSEIKYTFNVTGLHGNTVTLKGADFKVGEKIVLFTTNAEDYEVLYGDGTWQTILSVDAIKENSRPKLFEVLSVNGNVYELDGFNATVDISTGDQRLFSHPDYFGITATRITSFSDSEFVIPGTDTTGEIKLYSNYREYGIDSLDYDVFYDRWFSQASYGVQLQDDDLDGWYVTNETGVLEDGSEVDHGYYLPLYGQGALSELTRIKPMENIQIYVYEYNPDEIKTVYNSRARKYKFKYEYNLVSDIYISEVKPKVSVLYYSTDIAVPQASYPISIGDYVYNTGKIRSGSTVRDDILVFNGGMMHNIDGTHVLKGIHNSVEYAYENNKDVNLFGINLGKETSIKSVNYISDYDSTKGTYVTAEELEKLLKN